MALTFLGVPIVFTIWSFEFTKSNCRDFIANDESPPASIHWIIMFKGNAAVLSQASIAAKNS